jgi:hypothetical protein
MTTRRCAAGAVPSRHVVYWHRDLPPLSADVCGEDTIEAVSQRVIGSLARRGEAWDGCYRDLMERARTRLEQEVARKGADYAHVKDEVIDARHDEARGESWLYGRFGYVLYREPLPVHARSIGRS